MKRRIIAFRQYYHDFIASLNEKKVMVVVLFNGFQKKTQKTPTSEIDKALKIKEEYYDYKEQHAD
jgi:phage-related protein|nr:type II toxin-antitoxin system RelE/ParE family toxin [Bacteroides graminisolvens]